MPRRHPALPTIWLMTDERMGEGLWGALDGLPRGAGVVFRHYRTPDRRAVLARVEAVARRRGLVVVGAGIDASGGTHGGRKRRGLLTRSAHDVRDIVAAIRSGADAVFVSPVYPTRSHPGARTLGRVRLGLMIRDVRIPAIALGGVDARRCRALKALGVHGWAGIDAWAQNPSNGRQKRNAVPT